MAINLALSKEFKVTLAQSKETIQGVRDRYRELFDELSKDIKAHSESEHSIPNVSAKIGKQGISAVKAMMAVNAAAFEGQKLTNTYNVLYAPRMNELFYDGKAVCQALNHAFFNEISVQEIKTSAEKDRQRNSTCFEIDQVWEEIRKLHDSLYYLGSYVNNIVYSLDRMQKMIDSLDRLASRELWVDSKAQDDALNVIAETQDVQSYKRDTGTDNKFDLDEYDDEL